MTVVPEARVAAACGVRARGVTAMHDATEGGVLGGLAEIAEAARVGLVIERDRVPVRPEVAAVCKAAGMDPYAAISEGTLLLTVRPRHAGRVLAALGGAGIPAAEVGEVLPDHQGRTLVVDSRSQPLGHPGRDPFWTAYAAWHQASPPPPSR
jgi:hydrogenase expression/formation protein HypE